MQFDDRYDITQPLETFSEESNQPIFFFKSNRLEGKSKTKKGIQFTLISIIEGRRPLYITGRGVLKVDNYKCTLFTPLYYY